MKQTLLLTGGTGYIGSHCALRFLDAGYDIVIIDNLSNSSKSVIGNIEKISGEKIHFYQVDMCDTSHLDNIFQQHKIDSVVHFAGLKAVGESCEKPFLYYENNIVGSLRLFEVMEKHNCKKIIFSSSATVYNPLENPPFSEYSSTGNTTNPYGTTKFIIENILRDLASQKSWKVGNLRYFNPIGAHASGVIGENPNDIPNNLLPYIMKVAIGELPELSVFGDDYNTPDGTGVRDYIHVEDLANGHLATLEWIHALPYHEQGFFESFNLGTGQGTSVLEMIHLTEKVIGKKLAYRIQEKREGDIASAFCSPLKSEQILGWKAQKSVSEAIQDSWNFIQSTK